MLVGLLTAACTPSGVAQESSSESKSAPLVKEVGWLLERNDLRAIATVDPTDPDRFLAASFYPKAQLLALSARHGNPALLRELINDRNYHQVYAQLRSAGVREGKLFIQDLGADGLWLIRKRSEPFDIIYESVDRRTIFDGNWKRQTLPREEYEHRFRRADDRYARILSALIAILR